MQRHFKPLLTVEQVLAWADAYKARTGYWPNARSGPIPGADGATWSGVAGALVRGIRGLPAGSLHRLLVEHRGALDGRTARWRPRPPRQGPKDPRGRKPKSDRRQLALTLRAEGWTFQAIGERLGLTKQAAQQLHRRAMEEGQS